MDTHTVTIKCKPCAGNEKGQVVINASDFDPAQHTLAEEPSPEAVAIIEKRFGKPSDHAAEAAKAEQERLRLEQEEAERKAKEDADRQAKEEAERKAAEEAAAKKTADDQSAQGNAGQAGNDGGSGSSDGQSSDNGNGGKKKKGKAAGDGQS